MMLTKASSTKISSPPACDDGPQQNLIAVNLESRAADAKEGCNGDNADADHKEDASQADD
jgi:hypothetical protein